MARDEAFQSFAGPHADGPTREALREVLDWQLGVTRGPEVLVLAGAEGAALSILLARAPLARREGADEEVRTRIVVVLEEAELHAARLALEEEPPLVRRRVAPCAEPPAGERFDTVVVVGARATDARGEPLGLLGARLDRALQGVREGGEVVLTAPLDGAHTPSRVAGLARGRVVPLELAIHGAHLCLRARAGAPEPGDWDRVASPEALLALTEAAGEARAALLASRLEAEARARLEVITLAVDRARSTAQSLRSTLEQNVRLRQSLDRTRRSARYRVGDAVLGAARPSAETLRLPARLYDIYRAKTSGRAGAPQVEEPLTRLLDERLEGFLTRLASGAFPRVVVMFSGTALTGVRVNRPYALTRVLRARGIPVIFVYHGTVGDQFSPKNDDPLLLELPVDYAIGRLPAVARAPMGEAKRLFVVAFPIVQVTPLINRFNVNGWVTCYDVLDDWEEFARASFASWYSSSAERFVATNTDFSACVSGPLAEKVRGFAGAREVILSPNAYDPGFKRPGHTPRRIDRVKVGYFGHLTAAWFDWSAVRAVARKRPAYLFEIIGYGAPEGLEVPENVRLLGPKTPHEICKIAEEWRVAIIPFKTGKLADAVDPIKIYEYLALQLPVVSFRMPQIADYPYTRLVKGPEELALALDEASAIVIDPERTGAFIRENTWERRLDALLARADRVPAPGCAGAVEKLFHEVAGRSV